MHRESVVLLKNDGTLPLKDGTKVYAEAFGKSAEAGEAATKALREMLGNVTLVDTPDEAQVALLMVSPQSGAYFNATPGYLELDAILLGIASEKFKVPVDEKEVAIRAELPGNNCGGCGYAGCDGLAKAIANGEALVNGCPVGGAAAAEKISAIMGVEAGEFVKKVAFVKCAGTCEKASDKYQYSGVQSCIEAMNVPGAGPKGCEFGCMGFGSCAAVCPENAISIVNGIAHIDEEACVGCGKCAETCPKALIDLVPENKKTRVQCSSKEFGKNVMSVCKAGCIGCKACEKVCRLGAIKVENNIAQIDYDKCVGCGLCAGKCPKGIITGKKLVPKKPAPKKEA